MQWPPGLKLGTDWCLCLDEACSSFKIMNCVRLTCTLSSLGLAVTGYLRLWFQLKVENCRDSSSFSLFI